MVHDEENFTRPGDLVVIKATQKVSERKAFYIRNVVKQAGRYDYWDALLNEREIKLREAMKENMQKLREENSDSLRRVKTDKEKADLLKKLKMRAMNQAFLKIKRKTETKDQAIYE